MRIGFTSQNFRTITGHAGRTRRFLVFELASDGTATEVERFDLPTEMSMHEFKGEGAHPLDTLDVLVTKECGDGFLQRLAGRGVTVVTSPEETDPQVILRAIAAGQIDVRRPATTCCGAHRGQGHGHAHGHGHTHADGHTCCHDREAGGTTSAA
ncbi:nitrogen fixation protein [Roseospira marina]|uniref:Nitrogen fixation protein n=1 Tax=Roseospira marina TaxID=140057 RepID=A0A5M6IH59_9PROT|nr:NifB/NifX family molybdenum-iron cluster-binding protein [Roseospira marina]KAA5607564.1 nitrogen fixation protein [Roseospira marina]MBB4312248.1 putative Fe-Mo cluster-binding NifX family protein [Roseospira marina]MBB5085736.1 putative Fe-Mo cluster-binding NifX family protein [Roseospira marina]